MKIIGRTLIITLLFLIPAQSILAATVNLTMRNIRSTKGQILIGLYTSNDAFQNEKPYKKIKISKAGIKNGVLKHSIDLPAGTYGIALLDDENGNTEMDSNFFGIPNEGYGFSGYDHSGMFRPSFDSFKFTVKDGKITSIQINVDYF